MPGSAAPTLTQYVRYDLPPAKTGVKMFTPEQTDDLVGTEVGERL